MIRSTLTVDRRLRERRDRKELVRVNVLADHPVAASNIAATYVVLKYKIIACHLARQLRYRPVQPPPASDVARSLMATITDLDKQIKSLRLKKALAARPCKADIIKSSTLRQGNSAMACVLERALTCAKLERALRLRRSHALLVDQFIIRGRLDSTQSKLEFIRKRKTVGIKLASRLSYAGLVNRGIVNVARPRPTFEHRLSNFGPIFDDRAAISALVSQNILKCDPRRTAFQMGTSMDIALRRMQLNRKLRTRNVEERQNKVIFPTQTTISSKLSSAGVALYHAFAQDSLSRKLRLRCDQSVLIQGNIMQKKSPPMKRQAEAANLEQSIRRITLKTLLAKRPLPDEIKADPKAAPLSSTWNPLSVFGW